MGKLNELKTSNTDLCDRKNEIIKTYLLSSISRSESIYKRYSGSYIPYSHTDSYRIRNLLKMYCFFDDMDRPNQTGYLLLNEDGAVLASSGDLENDEKSATIIMGLINLTSQIDSNAFPPEEGFKKLSITYEDHCYIVCLSNRKIHIVKKTLDFPQNST